MPDAGKMIAGDATGTTRDFHAQFRGIAIIIKIALNWNHFDATRVGNRPSSPKLEILLVEEGERAELGVGPHRRQNCPRIQTAAQPHSGATKQRKSTSLDRFLKCQTEFFGEIIQSGS